MNKILRLYRYSGAILGEFSDPNNAYVRGNVAAESFDEALALVRTHMRGIRVTHFEECHESESVLLAD